MSKKNVTWKNYRIKGKISGRMRRLFVKRKYKDELFRRIFNNRKVLLELYNAINKTDYTDEKELGLRLRSMKVQRNEKRVVNNTCFQIWQLYHK